MRTTSLSLAVVCSLIAATAARASTLPDGFQESIVLDGLTLPTGFSAVVVHEGQGLARHIDVAPNGDIYIASRNGLSAMRDTNRDGKPDVVSTFGDIATWGHLASTRAIPSALNQTTKPEVFYNHGETLHEARNLGAEQAQSEWLCFLDADDELDSGYIQAMTRATEHLEGDWLIQPSTRGVVDGVEDPFPVLIPPKPLIDGNFLVIGTVIRRAQFLRIGGFHAWPLYEDWDLWLRAFLDGAAIRHAEDAIYRVHVNPQSRNNCSRDQQIHTYNAIRAAHNDTLQQKGVR